MKKIHRARIQALTLATVLTTSALVSVPAFASGAQANSSGSGKAVNSAEVRADNGLSETEKARLELISQANEKIAGLTFAKEFTMEQPGALSTLDLAECKGKGTFAFADPTIIPDKGITTCEIIFTPEKPDADVYVNIIGWDEETKTIHRYVQVVCTSLMTEEEKLAQQLAEESAGGSAEENAAESEMAGSIENNIGNNIESSVEDQAKQDDVQSVIPDATTGSVQESVQESVQDSGKTQEPSVTPGETEAPAVTETPQVSVTPDVSDSADNAGPEDSTKDSSEAEPEATATPTPVVTAPIRPGTHAENAVQMIVKNAVVKELETKISELGDTVADDTQLQAVLEVSGIYNTFTTEQKLSMDSDMSQKLADLQAAAAVYNHTDKGVTVSGNIPWYVALKVELDNDTENYVPTGLETIVPYEIGLWDMMNDTVYTLVDGEKATLTMAVPENLHLYDGLQVVHYIDENHYEFIELRIDGNMMSFETVSFSPFNVAGSNVLVGGIDTQATPTATPTPTPTATATPKPNTTTSSSSSNNTNNSTNKSNTSTNNTNNTNKNNTSSSSTGNSSKTVTAAKTGDAAEVSRYFVMSLGAAVLMMLAAVLLRFNKKQKMER